VLGAELGKERATRELLRRDAVDGNEVPKGRAFAVFGAFSHLPLELVSGSKVEFLDYPGTDIDVVLSRSIGFFPTPDEP
jgi:hypothetical protein